MAEVYVELDSVLNELDRFVGCLDEDMIHRLKIAIKRLPSKEIKPRYKPPKRLPCTCGSKQIGLWWDSERDLDGKARGWFMKCDRCGKRSKYFLYQNRANEMWNKTVEVRSI